MIFGKPLMVCQVALLTTIATMAPAQPSTSDTVRFLEQATFGPNSDLIAHVQSVGFSGFLQEQFAVPASSYPDLPLQPTTVPPTCTGTCVRDNYSMYPVQVTFFKNALAGQDQLRQATRFIRVTANIRNFRSDPHAA